MKKNYSLYNVICGISLAILMLLNSECTKATTYYSATNGGNWNSSSTWSTVSYGSGVNSGTYPIAGDIVYIGDGYTINITTSSGASGITVGQGTSGILQFSGAGTFTLTISGSLTIQNGGKLWYNSNNSRTHNLFISGNITNNGTLDLYYDSNDKVNITFNSSINSVVSGTGTWQLNDVTLTKSTSVTNYLEVQANGFETAIATLSLTYGTYIHNNPGTYSINSGGSLFTIDYNVVFKIPSGTVNFSPATSHCYLYGSLIINGGSAYLGSTSGSNGLRYDKTGANTPYLEISSGSMTVYGGISYKSGAGSDPFSFKMSGGNLLVNSGSAGTVVEPFLINDVANSIFDMSGGTITIQEPNYGGTSIVDFGICGTNGSVSVSAGIIQFGNASTSNNKTFNFLPFGNVVQPHFKISGTTAYNIKLQPSNGSTADIKILSMYIESGKTFDVRSISGTAGDTKTLTLTRTYDGTNALINDGSFTSRNGTVTFNNTGAQSLDGTTTTTFYNLIINNTSHITLNTPVNVSNSLTLSSGKLISSTANIITCLNGATSNIGSLTSYIDGPFIQNVATASPVTFNLPIGSGNSYHPLILNVQHTDATSVAYKAQMVNSPASGLGLALPVTLSKVSDIRYYVLNRQAVANFSSGNIRIYYYDDDIVTDYNNLRVAQDNGSTSWLNHGGVGTANGTGTITSGNFTSFNTKFSLANAVGGTNPLPVELITFNAELIDDLVKLNWETASELNTDYFTVERSYEDKNFIPTNRIKAIGNSNVNTTYHTTDRPVQKDQVYYRLRTTDQNGQTQLSKTVVVIFSNEAGLCIFPSPSNGKNIHIRLNDHGDFESKITAFDLSGNEIAMQYVYDPVKNEIVADLCNTVKSKENTYIIHVLAKGTEYKKKILVVYE